MKKYSNFKTLCEENNVDLKYGNMELELFKEARKHSVRPDCSFYLRDQKGGEFVVEVTYENNECSCPEEYYWV
jgi:hypothetical protein